MSDSSEMPPPTKRQKTTSNDDTANNDSSSSSNDASSGFNAAPETNNQSDIIIDTKHNYKYNIPLLPRDAKTLLLDIEGCTTSISFVKDVLFPFVLSNLDHYLSNIVKNDDIYDHEELKNILKGLKDDFDLLDSDHPSKLELQKNSSNSAEKGTKDTNNDVETMKKEIHKHVQALMNHDVKATNLKSLQGKIWNHGYTSHQLKGHTYQDFHPMLLWCQAHNVSVNIYSSGSIQAQQLLFGHSVDGDLTHYFHRHFDTTSGGKKNQQSYVNIANELGVDLKELCFVSDAEEELVAAKEAGVGFVVMSVRPGNAKLTNVGKEFPIVYSLLQLCGSGK